MRPLLTEAAGPSLHERYNRDGYVVLPGFFNATVRGAVQRDLDAVFRRRAEALGLDLPEGEDQRAFSELLAGLFRKDIPSYVAAAKLTQHLASVHAMGLSAELMGLLADLGMALPSISTRPVIHFMADRLRIPGGYQKTPPHQDWRSTQGSLDSVTLWSPLFDVGLADYPLEIIPGSHRGGLLPTVPDMPNERIADGACDPDAFVPAPLKAGDAVIFSGFLVHRTGERGGEQVRVSFSFRFNNAAEPSFAARNYPNPYLYRADPTIVTPGFAGPDDVEALFKP